MRKQQAVSAISSVNLKSNYQTKKQSLLNQFVVWFRNFLDNAE